MPYVNYNRRTTLRREDIIQKFLARDQKAIRWSILVLYKRQTSTEQVEEHTTNRNYRGFQPADALWLSRFAKYYLSGRMELTPKQMAIVMKPHGRKGLPRIAKYARQLLRIIEANAARKDAA